jgi:hypothetical protein
MSSEQLESSPDENAAVPIYKMSYEQLRAANIERNNAKLRELFGTDKLSFMSSVSVAPGKRASASTKNNAQSEELTDVSNSAGQPLGIAEQAAEFEKLVAEKMRFLHNRDQAIAVVRRQQEFDAAVWAARSG